MPRFVCVPGSRFFRWKVVDTMRTNRVICHGFSEEAYGIQIAKALNENPPSAEVDWGEPVGKEVW